MRPTPPSSSPPGAGFRRGLELPRITSRDVAPTLAQILGIRMGEVEGRVLLEILTWA